MEREGNLQSVDEEKHDYFLFFTGPEMLPKPCSQD